MKTTTSPGTLPKLPQTPRFFRLINCSVSKHFTTFPFLIIYVWIAKQFQIDEPVPSEPTPGAAAAHQEKAERDVVKATEYTEPAGRRGEGRPRTLTLGSRSCAITQYLSGVPTVTLQ